MKNLAYLLLFALATQAASYNASTHTEVECFPDPHITEVANTAFIKSLRLPPDYEYPHPQPSIECRDLAVEHLIKKALHLEKFHLISEDVAKITSPWGIGALVGFAVEADQTKFHTRANVATACLDKMLCSVLYIQILGSHFTAEDVRTTMKYASVDQLSAVYIAVRAYEDGQVKSEKGNLLKEELEKYPLPKKQKELWQKIQDGLREEVRLKEKHPKQLQWSVVWQVQGSWLQDWCMGAEHIARQSSAPFNPIKFTRSLDDHLYAAHHLQKNILEDHASDWAKVCIAKNTRDKFHETACISIDPSRKVFREAIAHSRQVIDPLIEELKSIRKKNTADAAPSEEEKDCSQRLFEAYRTAIMRFNPSEEQIRAFFGKNFPEQVTNLLATHRHIPSHSLFTQSLTHFVTRHRFLKEMHEKLDELHKKIGEESKLCQARRFEEFNTFNIYNTNAQNLVHSGSQNPKKHANLFFEQKALEDIQSAQICQLLRHALHTNSPVMNEVFDICTREDAFAVMNIMKGSEHEQTLHTLIESTYPGWLGNMTTFRPSLWFLNTVGNVLSKVIMEDTSEN